MLGMEMAEPPLQFQILRHGPHVLRAEAVIECALLGVPFPDGVETALDYQPPKINRTRRLIDKALLAGCVNHQICRALVVEALAHFVHQVDGITYACGRDITVRMAGSH